MSKLEEIRKQKRMTLEHVTNNMQISRMTLRKWEKSAIDNPVRKLEKLAKIYGINPIEFFTR